MMREGELRGDRASCVGGAKYNAVCTQRVIMGHCSPVSEAPRGPACPGTPRLAPRGLGWWSPQQPAVRARHGSGCPQAPGLQPPAQGSSGGPELEVLGLAPGLPPPAEGAG